MNRVIFNLFPKGKEKALTMSYDDGQIFDRRLVEIFNRHGIKGTFHLSSKKLGREPFINPEEVKTLYKGHEVSVHCATHPSLLAIPKAAIHQEILDDRKALESLVEYPIRGMSYPYGHYDEQLITILQSLGIEYSRTVFSNNRYRLSENFLEWHPTTHHRDEVIKKGKDFLQYDKPFMLKLMYVWGHSYEFDRNNNWDLIEEFCELMGNNNNIWYATNIEIVDYIKALRSLRFTAQQDLVYNPTLIDVWFTVNDRRVVVKSGEMVGL